MALYHEEINGGHIVLAQWDGAAWKPLVFGTSHSIEQTVETREVSNKETCGNRKVKPARTSWTGSGEGMNAYDGGGFTDLAKVQKLKETVYIVSMPNEPCVSDDDFGDAAGDMDLYECAYGPCLITTVTGDYPDEDNATYSVSYESQGELEFDTYANIKLLDPTA